MYHQREKYHLISTVSLGLAILVGIIAVYKSNYLLIIFSLFLITVSIISDAFFLNSSFQKTNALKQLIRGVVLFILIGFLFYMYIKKL